MASVRLCPRVRNPYHSCESCLQEIKENEKFRLYDTLRNYKLERFLDTCRKEYHKTIINKTIR